MAKHMGTIFLVVLITVVSIGAGLGLRSSGIEIEQFNQRQKQLADFCYSKGGMPIYAPGGYVTNCIGVCK